jgi:cytochrome c oxidase cbb3-type subunit 3
MSSPCRAERLLLVPLLIACVLGAGCEREKREFKDTGAPSLEPTPARVGSLQPGKPLPAPIDPHGRHFEGNAYHVNQGQQLFKWFNCSGCHANGGGAIGPALMDSEWRYGGSIEQIHASIAQGRPNGMPAFEGKVPDDQIWQLAAYVRTLSGNAPKYVAGGSRQGMAATPAPSRLPKLKPKTTESGQ